MYKKVTGLALVALFISQISLAAPNKIILTSKNAVVINSQFDSRSVAEVAEKAKMLESNDSKKHIFLIIRSPGGHIVDGLSLIDYLKAFNRPVDTITLFAASMGFQTVQGLNKRYITPSGVLMSHKASGQFVGEFPGQLDSRYNFWLNRITNMNKTTINRTNGKHTLRSYENLIENEYWCEGQDCVDQGFADEVVLVACDSSLSGTKTEEEKAQFMGYNVTLQLEYPNCPLISGITNFRISIEGKDIDSIKNIKKEVLNIIKQQAQELVKSKTDMKVIKGY